MRPSDEEIVNSLKKDQKIASERLDRNLEGYIAGNRDDEALSSSMSIWITLTKKVFDSEAIEVKRKLEIEGKKLSAAALDKLKIEP